MEVRVSEAGLRLRVSLGATAGSRAFGSLVALIFVAVGSVFVLASLPHTELFFAERVEGGFRCERAQALAGRWVIASTRVFVGPDARCEITRHEDEGSVTFQARVVSASGTLAFGKSKANLGAVRASVDAVNPLFATKGPSRIELRDDIWWWWIAPFGLAGMGLGGAVLAWLHGRDVWVFDRGTGRAERWFELLGRWRPRAWPLSELRGVTPVETTDHENDTVHNLELTLASGQKLNMASVSPPGAPSAPLADAARRINAFLRAPSDTIR